MANKKDFKQVLNETLQDIKVNVAEEFDKNFEKKAFFDKKWQPRKSKKAKGSLLIVTARLRRGTKVQVINNSVVFTNDTPYASAHNEGLKAGRGKGFTMPKRQFIGDSPKVQEMCKEIIEHNINDFLNNLI